MIWLRLFTYAGLVVFALFFATQVIIPLLFNRRLFPIFNKSEKKLESQIIDAHQAIHENELATEFQELRRELDEYSKTRESEHAPGIPEVVVTTIEVPAPTPKKRGRNPKTNNQQS